MEREQIIPERFSGVDPTCYVVEGGAVVTTHSIGLVRDAEGNVNEGSELLQPAYLPAMLQALRHASCQAGIAFRPDSVITIKPEDDRPYVFSEPTANREQHIDRYELDTAISSARLSKAHGTLLKGPPAVSHMILLDAIAALIRSEFRQAILYAAMAIEAAVTDWLDTKHRRILQRSGATGRHRVVRTPVSRSEVSVKDPVYEILRDRVSFQRLLHERPLYLTGRSLMLGKQALYTEALRLYETRSAIVHGEHPAGPRLLSLDVSGGRRALRCAIDVFGWIGQARCYLIPGIETGRYKPGRLELGAS